MKRGRDSDRARMPRLFGFAMDLPVGATFNVRKKPSVVAEIVGKVTVRNSVARDSATNTGCGGSGGRLSETSAYFYQCCFNAIEYKRIDETGEEWIRCSVQSTSLHQGSEGGEEGTGWLLARTSQGRNLLLPLNFTFSKTLLGYGDKARVNIRFSPDGGDLSNVLTTVGRGDAIAGFRGIEKSANGVWIKVELQNMIDGVDSGWIQRSTGNLDILALHSPDAGGGYGGMGKEEEKEEGVEVNAPNCTISTTGTDTAANAAKKNPNDLADAASIGASRSSPQKGNDSKEGGQKVKKCDEKQAMTEKTNKLKDDKLKDGHEPTMLTPFKAALTGSKDSVSKPELSCETGEESESGKERERSGSFTSRSWTSSPAQNEQILQKFRRRNSQTFADAAMRRKLSDTRSNTWSVLVDAAVKARDIDALIPLMEDHEGDSRAVKALLQLLRVCRDPIGRDARELETYISTADEFDVVRNSCFTKWVRQHLLVKVAFVEGAGGGGAGAAGAFNANANKEISSPPRNDVHILPGSPYESGTNMPSPPRNIILMANADGNASSPVIASPELEAVSAEIFSKYSSADAVMSKIRFRNFIVRCNDLGEIKDDHLDYIFDNFAKDNIMSSEGFCRYWSWRISTATRGALLELNALGYRADLRSEEKARHHSLSWRITPLTPSKPKKVRNAHAIDHTAQFSSDYQANLQHEVDNMKDRQGMVSSLSAVDIKVRLEEIAKAREVLSAEEETSEAERKELRRLIKETVSLRRQLNEVENAESQQE